MKPLNRFKILMAAFALCGVTAAQAAYPERSINLVVPFPPGGGTDATARLIADAMSPLLGQTIVVENRAGAAGAIGAQHVADAKPDGYTLFFTTMGAMVINPYLYSTLRYDPIDSFTPVGTVGYSGNVLVVNPAVKADTVPELIELAKAEPGKFTYGSSGVGSSSHLAGVMLESLAGIEMTHVPYKGSAPAVTDLEGGRIDMMIDNIPSHVELSKAGKVRPLAVSNVTHSPLFPGIPTMQEAGVPGYDVTIWYGILGPKGLPDDVTKKLSDAMRQVISRPEMQERLVKIGADPLIMTPQEFGNFIQQESEKWKKIVEQSGATNQ